MTVTIQRGFPEHQRETAARLYWEAFGPKLNRVMGPTARGEGFFARILDPDYAICALQDGDLVGFAGFKTSEGALTGGGWTDLRAAYGTFGAAWRAMVLSVLEREVEPGILLMDGICVDASARGQGLGTRLLHEICDFAKAEGLSKVRLDVIDSNPRARALYEREGFVAGETSYLGPLSGIFGIKSATRMEKTVT